MAHFYHHRKPEWYDSHFLASAISGRVAGASNIICHWIAANFDDVLWMLLTVVFEVSLGRLAFGYSWSQIVADYDLRQGRLMSLGLLLLLFAPFIATKIRDVEIDRRHSI